MGELQIQAEELNSEVWLTISPSKIHGVGVFAIRNIPRGTALQMSTSRRWYSSAVIPLIDKGIQISARQRNSGALRSGFVHPNADAHYQAWMNHSDTPNSNGHYALVDIKAGEEVTENYKNIGGEIT